MKKQNNKIKSLFNSPFKERENISLVSLLSLKEGLRVDLIKRDLI